ncbi:hypothetical protein JCM10213_008036 [Rhodosporidiobolus nylandii]
MAGQRQAQVGEKDDMHGSTVTAAQDGEATPTSPLNASPSSSPFLLSLPVELLDRIIDFLPRYPYSHLASACLVSQAFVPPARRCLYSDVMIQVATEDNGGATPRWSVPDPQSVGVGEAILHYGHLAALVKSFSFLTYDLQECDVECDEEIDDWRDYLFPHGPAHLRKIFDDDDLWSRDSRVFAALCSKSLNTARYFEALLRSMSNLRTLDYEGAEVVGGTGLPSICLPHRTTLNLPFCPLDFGLLPSLASLSVRPGLFRSPPIAFNPLDFPNPPPTSLISLRAHSYGAHNDVEIDPLLEQIFHRTAQSLTSLATTYPRPVLATLHSTSFTLPSVISLNLEIAVFRNAVSPNLRALEAWSLKCRGLSRVEVTPEWGEEQWELLEKRCEEKRVKLKITGW